MIELPVSPLLTVPYWMPQFSIPELQLSDTNQLPNDESTSKELAIERDLRQLYIPKNYKFKHYKLAFLILYFKS